jgi:diadenosine tetraphosphate (Ap4A) HIT family hydrolase
MSNDTILKFGYPQSLIREYDSWVVLLRPQQVTLGSLVLACKEEVRAFRDISTDSVGEMHRAIVDIESTLSGLFSYEKINYLMLMMVDPHVHFHVIPRYSRPLTCLGSEFGDPGWPGQPKLDFKTELDDATLNDLKTLISEKWPDRS